MRTFLLLLLTTFLGAIVPLRAQVPTLVNYQGRVESFSGTANFRFALANADGSEIYWSNDGTCKQGGEPAAAVSLAVEEGYYSVVLGDVTVPNMAAIPASVFRKPDIRLQVWFDDGTNGSRRLDPAERLIPVAYVADSALDGAHIAPAQLDLQPGGSAANPPPGTLRLVNRDGKLVVRDAEGNETSASASADSTSKAQAVAAAVTATTAATAPELFDDFTLRADGTIYESGSKPLIGSPYQFIGSNPNATVTGGKLMPTGGQLYYLDATLATPVRDVAVEYTNEEAPGGVFEGGIVLGIKTTGVIETDLIHIRLNRNTVNVEVGSPGSAGWQTIYSKVMPGNKVPLGVTLVSRIYILGDLLLIQHEGKTHSVKDPRIAEYNGNHVFFEALGPDGFFTQVGLKRLWANTPSGGIASDAPRGDEPQWLGQSDVLQSVILGQPVFPGNGRFGTAFGGGQPSETDKLAVDGKVLANGVYGSRPFAGEKALSSVVASNLVTAELPSPAGSVDADLLVPGFDDLPLAKNGESLTYQFLGTFGANANAKRIKIQAYSPNFIIFDSGKLNENGTTWSLEMKRVKLAGRSHQWLFVLRTPTKTITRHYEADTTGTMGYQFLGSGKAAGDVKILSGTQEARLNY
ncbi:hypothetical protein [Luteolibacter soli]|uniref:Uncharacterized protein n=1 Tax=Luteolibacter soli TaxID=3135280 RepID=A0ABU9B3K3_9BACT